MTERNINNLVINKLTKAQYNSLQEYNSDELYFVTDDYGVSASDLLGTGTTGQFYRGDNTWSSILDIGTNDNISQKSIVFKGNNRYLSFGAAGIQAYTGSTDTSIAGGLYFNYQGGLVQMGQSSSKKAPLTIHGEVYLKTGHLYLDGAQDTSSTENTTQIIFRRINNNTPTEHIAISTNSKKLILNQSSSTTLGQIIFNPVNNGNNYITSGTLTVNGSSADNTGNYNLYVKGPTKITGILTLDSASATSSKNVVLSYDENLEVLNFNFTQ